MIKLTKQQRRALYRKWRQDPQGLTYKQFRREVNAPSYYDGSILVYWSGMWLGIEPDGYTHS